MDLVQGLFDAQGCEASRGVLVPTLLHQFHQGRQGLERERGWEIERGTEKEERGRESL